MTHEITWTVSDERIREQLKLFGEKKGASAEIVIWAAFDFFLILSRSSRLGEGWINHMYDLFVEALTEMDRLRG